MLHRFTLSISLVLALSLVSAPEAAAELIKFEITGVVSSFDFGPDIFEGDIQIGMPFTASVLWDSTIADVDPDPVDGEYLADPAMGLIEFTVNFGSVEISNDPFSDTRVNIDVANPGSFFGVYSAFTVSNWPAGRGNLRSLQMQMLMSNLSSSVFADDSLPTLLDLADWESAQVLVAVLRSGQTTLVTSDIQTLTRVPVLPALTDCADGLDNDGDGFTDFPDDPQCNHPDDQSETPDCSDGIDNDVDGFIDFPDDPGCIAFWAIREDPACDDGVSNDSDGLTDFPADPGCFASWWPLEDPECDDGVENDTDGKIDFPADPGCRGRWSNVENPQCDDGVNNDPFQDSLADLNDPECKARWDTSEACGLGFELLVLLPPLFWLRGRRRQARA